MNRTSWRLLCCFLLLTGWGVSSFASGADVLSTNVIVQLNKLRQDRGLPLVIADTSLHRAARIHAAWIAKHDSITHFENRRSTATVFQRVALGHGTHAEVSEVLVTFQPTPGLTAMEWCRQVIDHCQTLKQDALVILDRDQAYGGGGVVIQKGGRIWACLVLAKARWNPPATVKLNKRAFGIHAGNDKACKSLDKTSYVQKRFLYAFEVDERNLEPKAGKKVKLFFSYPDYFAPKDVLKGPRGKMAPDIVYRDQFPCCRPNVLHGSPYHDGHLLHPRGWCYLAFWHQWAPKKWEKALVVRTHQLRPFPLDSTQNNIVLTKKHGYCRYLMPFSYPQRLLDPMDFEFAPDTIPFGNGQQWRRKQLTFKVGFQKGGTIPDEAALKPLLDSINSKGAELLSVRIRGMASIEGTLEINQDLHNRRAAAIVERIQKQQVKPVRMNSTSAENWPDWRKDVRGTKWASLLKLENDRLRDTLSRDKALLAALEPILSKHRYANVEIDLRWALDNRVTDDFLMDSLRKAVNSQNFRDAHALQSELWRRWEDGLVAADSLLVLEFPALEACLPMIHNQACLKERLFKDRKRDTSDMYAALSKTYPWFEARKVLAASIDALYALKCLPFPTWTLQSIQSLKKRNVPADLIRRMEFNYYAGLAWWTGTKHEVDPKMLRDVQVRYTGDTIDVHEAEELALFYNLCKTPNETIKLLRPFMKPGVYTDEMVFIFAWTAIHTPEAVSEKEWLEWMILAHKLDPERWRRLVDRDWQLLRWPELKKLYCNCEEV
ncbi:MAG: hypothetical protein U0176_21430 [Bacteroidia bacterium]